MQPLGTAAVSGPVQSLGRRPPGNRPNNGDQPVTDRHIEANVDGGAVSRFCRVAGSGGQERQQLGEDGRRGDGMLSGSGERGGD